MKKSTILNINGIICDSSEEVDFLNWLIELQEKGLISKIERSPSFLLSDEVSFNYKESKNLKTKIKVIDKKVILLRKHIYTPEFRVVWNDPSKVNKIFNYGIHTINGEVVSYFEVKPIYDQNNMTRLFKINQKWMYQKHGILVNLVIPQELFADTFTPRKFLRTKTGKKKKIGWEDKKIEEFLKND